MAHQIADLLKSEKAKVWTKGGLVRVYLRKGFLSINNDLSIDTSDVPGIAFAQGMARQLREAGYNVPERTVIGAAGGRVVV